MALTAVQFTVKCFQHSGLMRTMNLRNVVRAQEYSRWAHRRPSKIVDGDETFQEPKGHSVSQMLLNEVKFSHQKVQAKKVKPTPDPDATLNDDGTPVFYKLMDDDPMLSGLMLTVRSRKRREKENQILLEGRRLIVDAIEAGATPEVIIFSRVTDVRKLPLPDKGVKLYKIPYRTIQLWSGLTTTPGIMGIFKIPAVHTRKPARNALPLTIICDNIREPGNMGSVLRAAAGVGCQKIILTKGCVDLWEPKVLRSAAGAHFRVPIYKSQTWPEIEQLISEDAEVYVADNSPLSTESISNSETSGSDSDTDNDENIKNITEQIHSSSGNVDAQKLEKAGAGGKEDAEFLATTTDLSSEVSPESEQNSSSAYNNHLPLIPYYAADYTKSETVIIIGGETEGLSHESLSLAQDRYGVRVNVPLTNGVESLNTGTALGVVVFEMKRQLLMKHKNV